MEKKSITLIWLKSFFFTLVEVVVAYLLMGLLAGWLCDISAEKMYCWYNGIWHGINIQGNAARWLVSDSDVCLIAPSGNRTLAYTLLFWLFAVGGILVIVNIVLSVLKKVIWGKKSISNRMIMKAVLCVAMADEKLTGEEGELLSKLSKNVFGLTDDEFNALCDEVKNGDTSYSIQKSQVPELIDNMARMIAADRRISKEEKDLIYKVAEHNNFSKEKTDLLMRNHLNQSIVDYIVK